MKKKLVFKKPAATLNTLDEADLRKIAGGKKAAAQEPGDEPPVDVALEKKA